MDGPKHLSDEPSAALGNPQDAASYLLAPQWPDDHPLILSKQGFSRWTLPISDEQRRRIAATAITAFLKEKATELDLPTELHRFGLSYVKAGAYSQIRRLMVDGEPTAWMFELPVDLDGRNGVIVANNVHFEHYHSIGRIRFVPEPAYLHRGQATIDGTSGEVAVSVHRFFEGCEELNFGLGTLRRWDVSNREDPMAPLPRDSVADLLAEMMAIIVYHYEVDPASPDQGTSIGGIHVNGGDFIYRRGDDGRVDLKLITVRERCPEISIPLFVRSLIQWATPEEMVPDRLKVGGSLQFRSEFPVLISNPSIAFHGIARGLRYLQEDRGSPDAQAQADSETSRWLDLFTQSEMGQPYQAWVDRFREGSLALSFWNDAREGNPEARLMREIHRQLLHLQSTGEHLGDAHALAVTLDFIQERLGAV